MDAAMKAKFILALHKNSLQAFDAGGTVLPGPNSGGAVPNAVNPNTQGVLGPINGFLGLNNNYQAGAANIQPGTNVGQLNNAYSGVQGALQGQQGLASTLTPQAQQAAQAQATLSNQLANQAAGRGPNPAQAALNQATGENVANQAALMAGQRGASANPGMIARQIAQQGAATQQQAVGQSATLQAQQQLAAQAALANLSGNQISQAGQAINNNTGSQQAEQNILQGANTAANSTAASMQGNINNVNAGAAQSNQQANQSLFGGIASGISSIFGFAEGGMVDENSPHYPSAAYADGGMVPIAPQQINAPQSFAGQWLNSVPMSQTGANIASPGAVSPLQGPDWSKVFTKKKSSVDNTVDPNLLTAGLMAYGGNISKMAAKGGKVAAKGSKQKSKVADNSYANDKVPALLSEGEIVLPRSITTHPMAPQMAAQFVQAVLNKRKMGAMK